MASASEIVSRLTEAQKADFDAKFVDDLTAATIGNPAWRIDNLYRIKDERGRETRFVRNEAQRRFWNERWCLNVILKARQLGFSTQIAIEMLDGCLFRPNTTGGIIDLTMDDAVKKLDKIKFAYQHLPEYVQAKVSLAKANSETVEFSNGSRIDVGTSHRGGTLQHLHISEYGKISATRPDKAREIRTGAFGTIHIGQRIDVESTAEGNGGEFYDIVQRADALRKEGRELSELDFKLHFFAWYQHEGYRLDPKRVMISADVAEYFANLKAEHQIMIAPDQIAWYAAKRQQIGPDNIFREYPSFPEEAFKSSIEGAYFKRQMTRMRIDGRIGELNFDESRQVNTFWDIGNDTTAIWFHQTDGVRHRLIDYYENCDEQLAHYVFELRERSQRRGYRYGKHYGPHDLGNTDWSGPGKSRVEIARELGLTFTIVPRINNKDDAIEAARQFLSMTWINESRCAQGIRCLDNYRKRWNDVLATFSREPLHDWASHGADALQCGAMGWRPEQPARQRPQRTIIADDDHDGTGWMGV